ncbi:sperm-tail PG-rich repeat-containing protein 2-like isoform X1 [Ictalurus furcatus]|uniref:sperm-tail PG-rich repeat-containing protein 2-like isoform X1 n=1 Tax=Ictalurus furcatus TaxID=66913 RepID=UPI002350060D|nr:sperm-tail PG-rich repeat-containing protein 2-like isoform X1 [Ictalurus furcatus]
MYSRARRVTDLCAGSTSTANVGPGSYNIQRSAPERTGSYAPFLSLSSRHSVFDRLDSEQCSPGPAHYDGVLTWAPVPGGHSLQNRSRRFEEAESNIPGPGTYDIIQPWGKKLHPLTTPDRGIKVQLAVCYSGCVVPFCSCSQTYSSGQIKTYASTDVCRFFYCIPSQLKCIQSPSNTIKHHQTPSNTVKHREKLK